jgi:hypothetical protein
MCASTGLQLFAPQFSSPQPLLQQPELSRVRFSHAAFALLCLGCT